MADRGTLSKWFPMLIYEEQYETVKAALDTCGYRYAMCKHDKDLNELGEPKKVHWHVVVVSEKREWQTAFAKRIGVERRFVQHPLSTYPNGAMRYLTHMDDPEKAQYLRVDLQTNMPPAMLDKLHEKIVEKSKDEENECLLDDIEKLAQKSISYKDFLRLHPAFIYQANSLLKLVQIASDVQWNNTVDKETGEILC